MAREPDPVGVAVVGCGYWGPNLVRNFACCPLTRLVAVCDKDPARRAGAHALAPCARPVADFGELLADSAVEAVVVATPPKSHAALARAALLAGKHVLVEKPLATTPADAEGLVELAEARGRTLMVDHTYVYSPAVRKIKELVDAGELGELCHVDGVRINLGLFQNDVSVLWDLAVHDLAIVDYLVGRPAEGVSAVGASHVPSGLADVAYLHLHYGGGLLAAFHVSWLSPVKVRHLIVAGRDKSLVYNDLDPAEPVKVYDKGIRVAAGGEGRRQALVSYRLGDTHAPCLPREEPLQNVARHFAACVRSGQTPRTDGRAGLRLVQVLDLAERSLRARGRRLGLAAAALPRAA